MNEIGCPNCGRTVKWMERFAGKRVQCPKCKEPFHLPAAPASAGTDLPIRATLGARFAQTPNEAVEQEPIASACCERCGAAADETQDRYEFIAFTGESTLFLIFYYRHTYYGLQELHGLICRQCIARIQRRHLTPWAIGSTLFMLALAALGVLRPSSMVVIWTIIIAGILIFTPMLLFFPLGRRIIGQRIAIAVNRVRLMQIGLSKLKGGNSMYRQEYNGLPLGY